MISNNERIENLHARYNRLSLEQCDKLLGHFFGAMVVLSQLDARNDFTRVVASLYSAMEFAEGEAASPTPKGSPIPAQGNALGSSANSPTNPEGVAHPAIDI